MPGLSGRLATALERIRAAGSVRVHPRRFRIIPGAHGRYRVGAPSLLNKPGEFIAVAGPHTFSGRTVAALLHAGHIIPAKRKWVFVGRFVPVEIR